MPPASSLSDDNGASTSSIASTSKLAPPTEAVSSQIDHIDPPRRAGKQRMRFDEATLKSSKWKHDSLEDAPHNEVEDGFWARSKRRAQTDRGSMDYGESRGRIKDFEHDIWSDDQGAPVCSIV